MTAAVLWVALGAALVGLGYWLALYQPGRRVAEWLYERREARRYPIHLD